MNSSAQSAAVEVSCLSRKFGPKLALNQVSLQVKSGRVFGLVGANGAREDHSYQTPPRLIEG